MNSDFSELFNWLGFFCWTWLQSMFQNKGLLSDLLAVLLQGRIFLVSRWWILMTLMIVWLFPSHRYEATICSGKSRQMNCFNFNFILSITLVYDHRPEHYYEHVDMLTLAFSVNHGLAWYSLAEPQAWLPGWVLAFLNPPTVPDSFSAFY